MSTSENSKLSWLGTGLGHLGRLFRTAKIIKLQVLSYMFVLRIYGSSVAGYELKFLNGPKDDEAKSQVVQEASSYRWRWRDHPRLPPLLEWHNNLSTAWLCYTLAKCLAPQALCSLIKLLGPTLPAHCHLLGRFIFHPSVDTLTAGTICGLHLGWRLSQVAGCRANMLDTLTFVLHSREDLQYFRSLSSEQIERGRQMNVMLLRQVMCYKVGGVRSGLSFRFSFRFRPNRSERSHRHLVGVMAILNSASCIFFGSCYLLVGLIILAKILDDRHYLAAYPHCDPQLEQLNWQTDPAAWSLTPASSTHHLLALLADFCENWFIWLDSGLALAIILPLVYVLNYDLLLYWRHLHRKIELTLAAVRSRQLADFGRPSGGRLGQMASMATTEQAHRSLRYPADDGHFRRPPSLLFSRRLLNASHSSASEVSGPDEPIADLQAQIADFFHQIKKVGVFISDFLTVTVILWATVCLVYSYHLIATRSAALRPEKFQFPLAILTIQAFIFVGMSLISWHLLRLHRLCLRSYPLVCSLMALDTSRYKRNFPRVLDHFINRKSSTFLLLRQYPYMPATYISIIGWSISCVFLIDSLLRAR